jgi:hypothetical protein
VAPGEVPAEAVDGPQAIFGQGLCREDGRQWGISIYKPPCAEGVGGNGGATYRGVTEDEVLIVRYLGQVDPATQAILEGAKLADSPGVRARAFNGLNTYLNQHTQTYGREVVMVDYNASGPGDNDEASRADAVRIAEDIGAFAVFVGTPDAGVPKVLAEELAQRGVICICTVTLSSEFYLEHPPYIRHIEPGLVQHMPTIGRIERNQLLVDIDPSLIEHVQVDLDVSAQIEDAAPHPGQDPAELVDERLADGLETREG